MDFKERNISDSNSLKKEALDIDHWDPLPEISGSLLGDLLISTSVFGCFISILCYVYITIKLCINEVNELLLKWHTIELILCFITILIGHITLAFVQNIYTCFLSLTPTILLWILAFNTSMCISGIRYYIKSKALQSKVVNPKILIIFITCTKIFCYFVFIVTNILAFWYGIEVEFVVCANKQISNEYIHLVLFPICALIFSLILASIVFELKLKQLFKAEKRRNSTQPVSLEPWRVVGQNLEANNIPQKSTYISIFWILCSILLLSIFEGLVAADESPAAELDFQCTMILVSTILLALYLPIILIFTFDHKNNNIEILTQQPPSELQFHEIRNNAKLFPCEHFEEAEPTTNPERTGNKISESAVGLINGLCK